ncbi:MAG: hypothetical protein U9P00_05640 [Pseudomonadota bacterium]|nr:hypothetical protein [Pseudomonadota bacterium]
MTSKSFNRTVSASLLGFTFLTASSVTNAGEHDLWREQVQTTPSEPTTLTATIRQGTIPDYRLWREQRNAISADKTHVVYVAKLTHSRYVPGADYRLWREQVQPASNVTLEDLALRN